MAIYSCNIRSIGRTTHAEGTAGAHLRYIGRERAQAEIMAAHMPENPQDARTWMDRHEREARKNARLCDKLRLALPRELDETERAQLVQDYMSDLTRSRVPWYAAIHQTGKDAHNPHAHVVVVDRDIGTGKRVLCLSDSVRDREKKGLPGPTAVEWVRERWEYHANAALERAGHEARIDRRSLEAQGVEREAQIHVGPRAQHIDTKVKRPESKAVPDPTPQRPDRVIDYPMIDAGRTRRERNGEIIDLNLERAARSEDFETRVWAQLEREQRDRDQLVETQIVAADRRRTLEERRVRARYAEAEAEVRARRDAESRFTRDWLRQRHAPESQTLKDRHGGETAETARRQAGLFGRFLAAVDLTGRTRQRREEERRALEQRQAEERQALAEQLRQTRKAQADAVRARYGSQLDEIARAKKDKLGALKERQEAERRKDDALLQQRAAEREQASRTIQKQIEDWKRAQKERQRQEKARTAKPSPARSKAGREFKTQAQPEAPPPPDPVEARKREIADRWRQQREQRERSRGRGRERDMD